MTSPHILEGGILSGRSLAKELKATLKDDIAAFKTAADVAPTLAILRVGNDGAAAGYARAIEKNCKSVEVAFEGRTLPQEATQADVEAALDALNQDAKIHGIMILEPLPDQIDGDALIEKLNPAKDIDGVHPSNAGRLAAQRPPYFVPATPSGGMRLLQESGIDLTGKHAVVVGRSDIVGKPMAMLLLHQHSTVTIAHSRTTDLPALCRTADILCVAVGRAEMVKGDWIKPGAVVIDFGTTYTDDGLKGDCDQESVKAVAGMMSPVPGGAGPVTNVMLMQNLLDATKRLI